MTRLTVTALVCLTLAANGTQAQQSAIRAQRLQCEYLQDPIGIDTPAPRLSWVCVAGNSTDTASRSLRQTAWQVLVASSPQILAKDRGDYWNSGKIASDRSIAVAYAGTKLKALQQCFWKVRVWDNDDRPSAWSEPAQWTMALTNETQWQAKWLGYAPQSEQRHPERLTLEGACWIWGRDQLKPGQEIPVNETRYLRGALTLPTNAQVRSAQLLISVDGRYTATLNGQKVTETYGHIWSWTRARKVDVTADLRPGNNVLALLVRQEKQGTAGVIARLKVELADGKTITLDTDDAWRYTLKAPKGWESPGFDDDKWTPVGVYGKYGVEPWGKRVICPRPRVPAPIFRKRFTIDKPVRRALLCMTGLGYCEPRLNGAKIGRQVLEPALTKYDRRVLYRTYDVTGKLRKGENLLGAMLGNGWYNVRTVAVWNYDVAPWRGEPRFIAQLHIELQDGTTQQIISDASWRAAYGPVLYDCIRSGEHFDARAWQQGWDSPNFDDTNWDSAEVVSRPGGRLRAAVLPPSQVTQVIKPVTVKETKKGVFVFDLGQNIAGWARIKVTGPAGTTVTLRYAERIDTDGNITQVPINAHIRHGDLQTDHYTLSGQGTEIWEPRFTYHGFQYVEVTGWPGRPTLDSLQGCVVHTTFPGAGSFACSNELFDKVQQCTLWSYRGNFVNGYPTDCPHREKNGWTGDAHLAAELAQYNFQNTAGYEKWIADLRDEQQPDGNLPGMVPTSGWGYKWGNGPAWDSALVLIPWYLYRYQGDVRILEESYEAMKRYVDFMTSKANGNLVQHGLGDWVPAKTKTPTVVTSSGYYYADARILAETARLLNKPADAQKYSQLAEAIRQSFHAKLYRQNGSYANGSQTAQSCAIYQGLVPSDVKPLVAKRLAEAVDAADGHLDVGILGAKYLFHALSDNGYAERAYRIATQTTPPSYGAWIERGTTTLWEDWKDGSSRNHIMFGDISTWFYQTLAGIRLADSACAFHQFVVAPTPVGGLTWVKAEHDSMSGTIRSSWKKEGGRLVLEVSVPVNTSATIHVPLPRPEAQVTESGRPAENAPGLTAAGRDGKAAVFRAGSGNYRFEVQ